MKTIKILMMLLLTSAFLVSCGGPESDAKKAADLACEAAELMKEHGLMSDEVKEFSEKNEEFGKEIEEKYGPDGTASKEDKEAYDKAFEEAMKDCDVKFDE